MSTTRIFRSSYGPGEGRKGLAANTTLRLFLSARKAKCITTTWTVNYWNAMHCKYIDCRKKSPYLYHNSLANHNTKLTGTHHSEETKWSDLNLFYSTSKTKLINTRLIVQEVLSLKVQCGLSMMSWSIHTLFTDRPKQKRVWIDQDVIDGPLCTWVRFLYYSSSKDKCIDYLSIYEYFQFSTQRFG